MRHVAEVTEPNLNSVIMQTAKLYTTIIFSAAKMAGGIRQISGVTITMRVLSLILQKDLKCCAEIAILYENSYKAVLLNVN